MSKVYTIAEIGQAHDGSLGILHSYIDTVAGLGVNAIKFQTHIADAESSKHEPFRTKFSYEDETRFQYWKRMEFSLKQWQDIKDHCEAEGLEFMSSPFSNEAVDLLEAIGIKRYKIGSGEMNNLLMLKKIAATGKDIILSSGLSDWSELDQTVEFLTNYGNQLSILQCTTAYPTIPEGWGINIIRELKNRYKIPVGFSDHSGDIFAGLAAVAHGAEILEFHIVFHKRMFGPDASASLTPKQVKKLLLGIQQIKTAIDHPGNKEHNQDILELKNVFEKSLAINKALPAHHVITEDDLEAKKPAGLGVKASEYHSVIGRSLRRPLEKWSFLNESDLLDKDENG